MDLVCESCGKQFSIKNYNIYQETHIKTLCRECTSNETKRNNIETGNIRKGIEPLDISLFSLEEINIVQSNRIVTCKDLKSYPELKLKINNLRGLRPVDQVIYDLKHLDESHRCLICGAPSLFSTQLKHYRQTCSAECGRKLSHINMSKHLKETYGVSNSSQVKSVISKKESNTYHKLKQKFSDSYEFLFSEEDYKGVADSEGHYIPYSFKCKTCGSEFKGSLDNGNLIKCPKCYPKMNGTSHAEKEIADYIRSIYSGPVLQNTRKVIKTIDKQLELDIYIPDKKVAIEFNGLYWHSEKAHLEDPNVGNYHLLKTQLCEEQNIRLIHIFEDEWNNHKDICKSIIASSLGVYSRKVHARKCTVRDCNLEESKDFLENNHLQGYSSSSIRLGLFYENELVSILTFAKPRFSKEYDWEIVRFANKLNTSVPGSFSKLLKYFKHEGSIVTYSDRRLFSGNVYRNNSFVELTPTTPNYFYTNERERISRYSMQKHKLLRKYPQEDTSLTEYEIARKHGWYRIYDCGHWKFEKRP